MGYYEDKIFPWILDKTEPPEISVQRRLALEGVSGSVLEIGLGTGGNLPFYPDTVKKIAAVEPSVGMNERAKARAAGLGLVIDWHQLKGGDLPFEDNTFDTVVTTQLLCSVDNMKDVLDEAFRVLKVGGKYHFLEHVISENPKVQKWQKRLNTMHKHVACGCQITRDIGAAIADSEFQVLQLHQVPPFEGLDQQLYPFIRGVAEKPDGSLKK